MHTCGLSRPEQIWNMCLFGSLGQQDVSLTWVEASRMWPRAWPPALPPWWSTRAMESGAMMFVLMVVVVVVMIALHFMVGEFSSHTRKPRNGFKWFWNGFKWFWNHFKIAKFYHGMKTVQISQGFNRKLGNLSWCHQGIGPRVIAIHPAYNTKVISKQW